MKRAQREAFRRDERERRRALISRLDDQVAARDPLAGVYGIDRVARRIAVAPSTIRAYIAREQMPAPSGRFGREPYWVADVIEPWIDGVCARRRERVDADVTPDRRVPLDE